MGILKLLDCTLRDGGYYNHWDFDPDLVQAYLKAIASSGIEFVELGFRSVTKSGFFGAFAYTTEEYIRHLDLPPGPAYGVMVDAKNILNAESSVSNVINHLFCDANSSPISLVRVAVHFHDVERAEEIVECIKAKGYSVGVNLMQAGGKDSSLIETVAAKISQWGGVDVLYFADSLGNMDRAEIKRVVECIRLSWNGDLGVHAHNNMGRALDNCMTAMDAGVTWVDTTLCGMGRGAGNAQTEIFLSSLGKIGREYRTDGIYDLAIRWFEPLQREFGWGMNLLYFLGAQNNLHPTYIQNLLHDTHFQVDEIIGSIDYLSKQQNSSSYDGKVYQSALSVLEDGADGVGSNKLVGLAQNKEVLLLANGPGLHRHKAAVIDYIETRKPIVVAINVIEGFDKVVSYYCISRNNKFLSESDKYANLKGKIILPLSKFDDGELTLFSDKCVLIDYGMKVYKGEMEASPNGCIVPYNLTAPFAFSAAEAMNAERVTLAGFDGYPSSDKRQLEMIELFSLMRGFKIISSLKSLTPTTYPVAQGSIYAPDFQL